MPSFLLLRQLPPNFIHFYQPYAVISFFTLVYYQSNRSFCYQSWHTLDMTWLVNIKAFDSILKEFKPKALSALVSKQDVFMSTRSGYGKVLIVVCSPLERALPGWLSAERVGLMTWWL